MFEAATPLLRSSGGALLSAQTPSVDSITDSEYKAKSVEWNREYGEAYRRGEDTPMPPLNIKQRMIIREKLLPALQTLACARRNSSYKKLGTPLFSAYTGVAVTQLPMPAATLCTLLSFPVTGVTPMHDLPDPTDSEIRKFEALVGDVTQLSLLTVDEIFFIGTPLIHHVNRRVQKFLKCDLPFGGLVVLFMGDFHQLPPCSGFAIYRQLVLDAL